MIDKDEKNVSVTSNKDDLITWLRGGNRTFGWDAIIGFDKSAIDTVFQEQYVRRFNDEKRFPVITGSIDVGGRDFRTLASVVLGPPKVSFDISRVDVATPRVRVTLALVSAQEVKLTYGIDEYITVSRINPITILQSPELTGVLDFKPIAYEGGLGVVALDLKDGTYEFTLADSDWEATKVGAFFKKQFMTWTSEESEWVVNRMLRSEGPLAVERFAIRSQRKSVTARASDPNYGEGAVLAFVKMEAQEGENSDGSDKTSFPTSEEAMHYWVPDDPGEQYTTAIVIQDARLLYALIMSVFKHQNFGMFHRQPFKFSVTTVAGRNSLVIEEAVLMVPSSDEYRPTPAHHLLWTGTTVSIGTGGNTFSIEIEQPSAANNFEVSVLARVSLVDVVQTVITTSDTANTPEQSETMWSGKCQIRFVLGFDNNEKSIKVRTVSHVIYDLSFKPYQYKPIILTWEQITPYLPIAASACLRGLKSYDSRSTALELFPLTSLLFHFPYITKLAEVSLAQDTVMFGHIAPGLMDFKVTDPFPVVAAGSTYRLMTSDPSILVVWSIRNVLGEHEPIGSVRLGVYTAPTADQISGAQVRVVVTATAGLKTAAALLTVVRNPVELNPLLEFIDANSPPARLEVGTLSGTPVWGNVDPARGRLEAIPGEPNARLFHPPGASVPGVKLDVVPVSVTVGGVPARAFVGVTHGLVIYKPVATTFDVANRRVQLELSGAQSDELAQLKLMLAALQSGVETAPADPVWEVVAGSATIDRSSGLLTADADPALPFVVVTVTVDLNMPPVPVLWGHVTLTLPLAPFPKEPEPEALDSESDLFVSLNQSQHS